MSSVEITELVCLASGNLCAFRDICQIYQPWEQYYYYQLGFSHS